MNFILFADDTTILYSDEDIESKIELVNRELKEVSNWFQANKLSVNASKTNFMLMGTTYRTNKYVNTFTNGNKFNIILDNIILERVDRTKFLGLIIDENLTWKYHIDGLTKTISRNCGVLNKLKHYKPERILFTLYCTLILPYINYSILVWGKTCKMYLDKILKLQKWAVRTISKSHYRCHSNPLFSRLKILNVHVYDTYTLELGTFYKHRTNKLPNTFDNYFVKHVDVHNYHTRNANNYSLSKNKKAFSDRTIRSSGPILWNSLNENIKQSKSAMHFKNKLKAELLMAYI